MSGVWRLSLLLVLLAVLHAEAAKKKKGCPRVQGKFERRLNNCYKALFSSYDPDDPDEFCGVYQHVLACVDGWIDKCSHRSWMTDRGQELAEETQMVRNVLKSQCADVE